MQGIWVLLLVLAASHSYGAAVTGTPRTEFRKIYSLAPDGRVVIRNLYGDVRITVWDRDAVEVNAIKSGTDPRRLDDARVVVDCASRQLLSIRTQYDGVDAEHPASVEYRITVPRRAKLEEVQLTNGKLSLSGLSGPVKASAVNGNIRAEKLGGQADLSTINGTLEADFDRISRSNPISLRSVNGSISLSIPSGSGATVVAENLSGGIQSDVGGVSPNGGSHRLHAAVEGGGAPIRVSNTNGGISIHSGLCRRAARPCW
jgi:hypothetical protein